jgi:hypothetical protein
VSSLIIPTLSRYIIFNYRIRLTRDVRVIYYYAFGGGGNGDIGLIAMSMCAFLAKRAPAFFAEELVRVIANGDSRLNEKPHRIIVVVIVAEPDRFPIEFLVGSISYTRQSLSSAPSLRQAKQRSPFNCVRALR